MNYINKNFAPLRLCVILCLCLYCSLLSASSDECLDSICRLTAGDGGRGSGCVFEINDNYVWIVTAAHLANGSMRVEFFDSGIAMSPVSGQTTIRDAQLDVALVAIPRSSFGTWLPSVMPFAAEDYQLNPGDDVESAGCANGAVPTYFKGRVLEVNAEEVRFNPPPAGGRSGSVLCRNGRIVGIIVARTIGGVVRGVAVPLKLIYRAMRGQNQVPGNSNCPGGVCPAPQPLNPRPPLRPNPSIPSPQVPKNGNRDSPSRPPIPNPLTPPDSPALDENHPIVKNLRERIDGLEKGPVKSLQERLEALSNKGDSTQSIAENAAGGVLRIATQIETIHNSPGMAEVRSAAKEIAIDVVKEKAPAAIDLMLPGLLAALGVSSPIAGVGVFLASRAIKKVAAKIGSQESGDRRQETNEIPRACYPREMATAPRSRAPNPEPPAPRPSPPVQNPEPPATILWQNQPTMEAAVVNRQSNRYIRVPQTDLEAESYKEALAKFAQANPQLAPSLECVEQLAANILHGKQTDARMKTAAGKIEPIISPQS